MHLDPRSFLTVSEVSREVRADPKTIYRAIRAGELNASKIPGHPRSTRVQWRDVEQWLGIVDDDADGKEQAVADRLAVSGA